MPILIDNGSSPAFVSGAYLLRIDTQTPIGQGLMAADGRDIRIADSCGTLAYPFWVEGDLNTDSTEIWVRIPTLLSGDSLELFLYHGNPAASNASNFNTTFPNAYQTGGSNDTLTGVLAFDWFEVTGGDTLFIDPGAVLNVRASKILVEGVIMGDGAGYAAPSGFDMAGNGPGAGQPSFNAGSGGGGYGGAGGMGGYDLADSPGAGGNSYGTRIGVDLDMGSSGASSPIRMGGAGGGALIAKAQTIQIGGGVFCRGMDAQQPGGNLGGGGGAGGGIFLQCRRLHLLGGLFATGGAGSAGNFIGNDDGGGGGGGRIKVFWEEAFDDQGSMKVDGGTGGPWGSWAPGEDGADGSLLDTFQVFAAPYFSTGTSVMSNLPDDPSLVPNGGQACENEPVVFTMPQGYDNFQFYLNGILQQDSSLSTYAPGPLAQGDVVVVKADFGSCQATDTLVAQPLPAPSVDIVASDSPACLGDTILLDAGAGWNSVVWNTGDSTQVYAATFSGSFIATVTDANNCPARDTYIVNLGAVPFPVISVAGLPACAGDPVNLSTTLPYSGYLWSNGASGPNTVIFGSTVVFVTVTGSNGCENTASTNIVYDPLPFPTISQSNDSLLTQPGYASYQWLWNGSPLFNANDYWHIPSFNGNYSVEVEGQNGCLGTSSSTYIVVGLEDARVDQLEVAPQPARDQIRLIGEWPEVSVPELCLYNGVGSLVKRVIPGSTAELSMELSSISSGAYWLIIRGKTHVERKKILVVK